MKIKLLLFSLFIVAFSSGIFAQSVVVTSRKTTYQRPKSVAEWKRSFTVNYPKIKASTPALSKKIETAISYQKNVGLNINEEKTETQWLEEADYQVGYNKNGILSIYLSMSGTGAYPSVFGQNVVVDLKTGRTVKPAEAFVNLTGLAAVLKKQMQDEIKESIEEIKKEPDYKDFNYNEYFKDANFTTKNLDGFAVGEEGVTFNYEYGFPHIALALEPSGNFFLTWKEIKPYIKRGGVFQKFIR